MSADPRIDELKTLLPRCLLHDWVRLGARLVRVLRDPHHAARHDALIDRLLARARASVELREWRAGHVPVVSYPPDLPITARKDDIIEAIRRHQVVVLAGETGSGKTTQIPKMCLEAGLGIEAKIACTQPRRVAALSISRRVAEELNVDWGREVGSKVRFDDRSSPETFIKFVTDGMLLAELQGDPELSEYNAIIVDEAHERSLNIDFLLGHLKGLLPRRPDLKLVVTSATIDTAAFSQAFWDAPVIEVSGRMFPVELVYAPLDAESEERGDLTYIDASVRAAEQALTSPGAGDLLIFLPSERDIREASDQLEGRFGREVEVIPLYGRLSAGDQQRAFLPTARTKIVVATNIAETSLTIPGIRYVIDAGLSRISRYNPRTRTRRLPVEPVSQSSARQRQGRAGRVRDGVCIRLYSEEDFLARPAETQPEIQRANLAEVILRMKAFHLGDIETFPFLNPPTPAAIRAGYTLLHELGAIDEKRDLTPLGRDLARLPIDPTLGRMLLQSQQEHATHELLIIAAGLSVQDPRERPIEQKEAADTAHRRFVDARSDFLTLLNLWNAVHDEWETLRTQNQRRRFCRAHFLSYTRMREWQDLYTQLLEALEERGNVRLNDSTAEYGPIHRSILAGLLGHVGCRKERNTYRGAGNREVVVFPGSALHSRGEPPRRPGARGEWGAPGAEIGARPRPAGQPAWMMAGEIVETSQLFARTVAGIEPEWIVSLAPHLCKVTRRNPRWSRNAGRVLVEEIITLHGLEVLRRKVAYANHEPREATSIFLRSALVEEGLLGSTEEEIDFEPAEPRAGRAAGGRHLPAVPAPPDLRRAVVPPQYGFIEHNRRVRQTVESWRTRLRRSVGGDADEALLRCYVARVGESTVASVDELNRWLRENGGPDALFVTETDLTGGEAPATEDGAFPPAVEVGGAAVSLSYAYAPGETWDGVTLRLPAEVARTATAASVAWSVPGLRAELALELLGSLTKTSRRALQPFAPKVEEIVRDLRPEGPTLAHDLSRFVRERYGVTVPVSEWRPESLPAHLRPRMEVVGPDQQPLAAGRDLLELREALRRAEAEALVRAQAALSTRPPAGLTGMATRPGVRTATAAVAPSEWERVAREWERPAMTAWSFGDLPERLTVGEHGGLVVHAWPGLQGEEGAVSVRLFRSPESARVASLAGVRRLVELALGKDLGWLQRDLRALQRLALLHASLGRIEELEESAFEHARRLILPAAPLPALTEAAFTAALEQSRSRVPGLATQLMDRITAILQSRQLVAVKLGEVPVSTASSAAIAGGSKVGPARSQTLKDLGQLALPVAARAGKGAGSGAGPAVGLAAELSALLPPRFLDVIPFDRLPQYPRYLKALLLRAERAALNPTKDRERAAQLAPYVATLAKLRAAREVPADARQGIEEFRWMVEEFRVSLFAQELGTQMPVSPKRLDQHLEKLRFLVGS